jgi:broad specificity phosphatase PhoE
VQLGRGTAGVSLLLVRHGETALNAARILQPAATCLSARGLAQAAALGRRLAKAPVAAIVSSDLPRARQTAEAMGAACGLAWDEDPLLQERNYGELRGLAYDSLGCDPLRLADAPPGGESAAAFEDRVAAAFDAVVARHDRLAGDLVVVTHGLVLSVMLRRHLALADGLAMPTRWRNASLTVASSAPPNIVSLLDCTAHLDAADQDDPQGLSGG